MLSFFKKPLFNRGKPADLADSHERRLAIYERELDAPEYTFRDPGDRRIDVQAFGRDFVPDWLATVPFIDSTWFGFGHRVPMPAPPVPGTDFRTFLLLTPVITPDQRIAEARFRWRAIPWRS